MTPSSENKVYTAADIERYHGDKMTAAERHALEKAAMEDPFLADALEGFAYTASAGEDLARIRKRLDEKRAGRKSIPLFLNNNKWLKAAAIILIVAGGSWLAVRMLDTQKRDLAIETPPGAQRPTIGRQHPGPAAVHDSLAEKDTSGTAIASNHAKEGALSNGAAVQPGSVKERLDQGDTVFNSFAYNRMVESQNRGYSPIPVPVDPGKYDFRFSVSDSTGAMDRSMTNNQSATQLTNSYPTYNARSYDDAMVKDRLAGSDTGHLNIVLQPSKEKVSEVTLATTKKEAARKPIPEVVVDTLEPAGGWAWFNDYVAANIKLPEELKTKQALSGEVELSFDINRRGEPVNITVTRSLCAQCDMEAVRLLKEGPKWKKKKDRKGKVIIRF